MLKKDEKRNNYNAVINVESQKLSALWKSALIGIGVGLITTAYRFTLMKAESYSHSIYDFFRDRPMYLPLVFIGLAAAGYFVGFLVDRCKMISGSGVPQVKGTILGYFTPDWLKTLAGKFVGGAIAILAGLSLGREGPSIQLGASIAQGMGDYIGSSRTERKVLIASGGGAGLAAAFNAPLAGVMFAMEEIFKYFSPVVLLSAMVSAVIADFISKTAFGTNPVFHFELQSLIPLRGYWLLVLLGAVLGVSGAFYNYVLIGWQQFYKKISWLNTRTMPIIPFLLAGVMGLIFPVVLGGGHTLIDQLTETAPLGGLILLLGVKFLFSTISFGSGAPGGIFFPLLVMGATIGAIFGNIAIHLGYDSVLFYNFVVLAMAGYFTAIVRAPITGTILLVEMTGTFTHLLSLAIVSISAYVLADLLKSAPVYDTMLDNMVVEHDLEMDESAKSKKIIINTIIHHGAPCDGKMLKDVGFPKNCLGISIKRGEHEMIPKGDSVLMSGDELKFLANLCDEVPLRIALGEMTANE